MKLGEQWIEMIDGQEHMVKAVRPVELCQGCLYNGNGGGCWWKGFDDECEMGSRFIIKDLGILNDGLLPCPFCGSYPSTDVDGVAYCNTCGCDIDSDKWNRRS
jgi:hypothetical protein